MLKVPKVCILGSGFLCLPKPRSRDAGGEGSRGREERQPRDLRGGVADWAISSKLIKGLWEGSVTANFTFVSAASL